MGAVERGDGAVVIAAGDASTVAAWACGHTRLSGADPSSAAHALVRGAVGVQE